MNIRDKKIIISPSGKLYGSEQVLLDFLKHTTYQYVVYLPQHSLLCKEVLMLNKHCIKQFKPQLLFKLYLLVALNLILKGYKSVYINEGGHIKYIKLLAFFFRQVKFTVHLRMVYDAEESRLGHKPFSNIRLIAISNHVAKKIPAQWNCTVVYDPYLFTNDLNGRVEVPVQLSSVFRVGVIGRISSTKGFMELALLLKRLESSGTEGISFNLFGSLSNEKSIQNKASEITAYKHVKVGFNGFVNQSEIYNNIDCVCHFCEDEGLGRVFFESIDRLKPFIGFQKGGLTEIASAFQLNNFLIEKNNEDWVNSFIKKLIYTQDHYQEVVDQIKNARRNFAATFSMKEYMHKIEILI